MALPMRVMMLSLSAVAALLAAGCSTVDTTSSGASEQIGVTTFTAGQRPAMPAVSGRTVTGATLGLRADRGHVVVLNFWGSWCSVCHQEASVLAAAAREFAPSGVRFVGVDVEDNSASARAFMRHFGISYPSLNDSGDAVAAEFNHLIPVVDFPSTLVIAPDGRIAGRVIGATSARDLRLLIKDAR